MTRYCAAEHCYRLVRSYRLCVDHRCEAVGCGIAKKPGYKGCDSHFKDNNPEYQCEKCDTAVEKKGDLCFPHAHMCPWRGCDKTRSKYISYIKGYKVYSWCDEHAELYRAKTTVENADRNRNMSRELQKKKSMARQGLCQYKDPGKPYCSESKLEGLNTCRRHTCRGPNCKNIPGHLGMFCKLHRPTIDLVITLGK